MKKFWELFFISIKRGFTTPSLPKEIILFHKKLYVRVFRVIGLYSTSALLVNSYKEFHVNYSLSFYVMLVLFNFLYIVYNCWLNYHRFHHMKKVLKSGELDIKNSPIKKLASVASKSYFCLKGTCEFLGIVGGGFGLCAGVDGVLTQAGHDPVFYPAIAKLVDPLLPVNERLLINTVRKKEQCASEELRLWSEYYDSAVKGNTEYSKSLEKELLNKIDEKNKIDQRIIVIQNKLNKK